MEVPVAGAVINTIVGSSLKNLISLLTKEFSLIKGVEKNVEKLVSVLSTIQAVMEDAEEQQIKNKQISDWLRKLKDATYDAEDVLDAWALKIQDHNQMEAANKVSRMRFRHKIAKKIKKVISKFDEIADEQKFHLKTGSVNQDTSESQYIKDRETSSVTTDPRIYGAEENKTKIIAILVNTFVNQDDVSICPIVGMGGLGKTTLAQSVYNDERVKRHFELRKWVCVSEPFDVKRILEAITKTFIPGTLEDVCTDVEEITSLPEGLGSMSSLSHLDLSRCDSITSLPEGLGSMSSLRHLDLSYCNKLSKMQVGIGKLTCLETLNWFVVGNWLSDGDNGGGGASISELQGLNQLKGWLRISGLENVRNGEDAKEANLSSKTHLSGLELLWNWDREVNNTKEVLEGLLWLPQNNNITRLEIWYYKAAYFPEVFLQKLTSLEKLVIRSCTRLKSLGCTWTQGDSNPNTSSSAFSSSHFNSSSLQELYIWDCPELLFSEEDFYNLDALRELTLEGLPQLTALPQGIQHLPMLRRLEIRGCNNLRIFPAWVKRRENEKGEDWLFICRDSYNWEFAPEFGPEEYANEPATEETTEQVNNDENTIVELDGSATEPITDNPNIESAPDEEAKPATEPEKEVNYIERMARLVSSTVARCILCCCSSSEKKEQL